MLKLVEKPEHARSRIEQLNEKPKRSIATKSGTSIFPKTGYVLLWILIATSAYLILEKIMQYINPTSGWIDSGMLSLSLFAAWACLLGYGTAGLLPALFHRISKKGGIKTWTSKRMQLVGTWLIYITYIFVLCTLL